MASRTKAVSPASAVPNAAFSRLPGPLPAACSGELAHDLTLDVVANLTEGALDLGEPLWDDALAKSMSTKERRAYQAASDAAWSGQQARQAWLTGIMNEALEREGGRARLTEIARLAPHPLARQLAANALFSATPTRDELAAIATMFDLPGDPNKLMLVHACGARAILMLDPAAAFEALGSRADAGSVQLGLSLTAPAIDPRWLPVLLPLVGGKNLSAAFGAITILTKLPPDPRMMDAMLVHLGPSPDKAFYSPQVLSLLARCGDARAVPYLIASLTKSSHHDLSLDALRHIGEPVAVHGIRAWRVAHEAFASAEWSGFKAADDVIAYLESRGPVPDAPRPAPNGAPPRRQRRKLGRAPKVTLPKAESVETQRAHLTEILAEQALAHHADALIRTAIAFVARRTKDAALPVGASKLGGCPDLPVGVAWPRIGKQALAFVAQIALTEVNALDLERQLPETGLLSFFVMDEAFEDGYLEHAIALYTEDTSSLVRAKVPADFDQRPPELDIREPYEACTLVFRSRLTLPSSSQAHVAKLMTPQEQERYAALDFRDGDRNQLLGWRDQGYDDTPIGTRLLLQCTSDEQAAMQWGDLETLSLLIDEEALRQRRFAAIQPKVGD